MSSDPTEHLAALDRAHAGGEPAGQAHAAGRDAEQQDVGAALGAFEDFVRDAGKRAADVGSVKDLARTVGDQRGRGRGTC